MIDVEKTLDKILGKVEVKELLWTNPNPSANFSAQTINIDLTGYDEIEICFHGFTYNGDRHFVRRYNIPSLSVIEVAFDWIYTRTIDITSSNIEFDDGYARTTSTTTASNEYCKPIKIYGIKWGGIA